MKSLLLIFLGALIGGVVGFSYYFYVGCRSGACPITSNPYFSILWGIILGIILFYPRKEKGKK